MLAEARRCDGAGGETGGPPCGESPQDARDAAGQILSA